MCHRGPTTTTHDAANAPLGSDAGSAYGEVCRLDTSMAEMTTGHSSRQVIPGGNHIGKIDKIDKIRRRLTRPPNIV